MCIRDRDSISDPLGPRTSFRCSEFGILCDGLPIGREPRELDPAGGALECTPQGATAPGASDYLWHPDVFVEFLRTLKPLDPQLIMVAAIVGDPDPVAISLDADGFPKLDASCTSGHGDATPGVRFKYFLDQFPERNTFTSICNADLAVALTQVAELLARTIGP